MNFRKSIIRPVIVSLLVIILLAGCGALKEKVGDPDISLSVNELLRLGRGQFRTLSDPGGNGFIFEIRVLDQGESSEYKDLTYEPMFGLTMKVEEGVLNSQTAFTLTSLVNEDFIIFGETDQYGEAVKEMFVKEEQYVVLKGEFKDPTLEDVLIYIGN